MVNAQQWLDKNYHQEQRKKVYKIYLNEPNLEGELDLGDFTYKWLKVYVAFSVDETKLVFKNLPKYAVINLINAQRDINYHYPTKESKKKVKILDIGKKKLAGDLDLTDFISLKSLRCSGNKLTFLNLIDCSHLVEIGAYSNLLVKIILPNNPANLKFINLTSNNLNQDLSFLVPYINLERLYLGSNKFTGSLDYLSDMKQLIDLDISDTDVEGDKDDLLRRLRHYYTTQQLEKHEYGLCQKCQQINTSPDWCQPCAEKEWKQLTGQKLIERFIQQQKILKWIPYEQFANIEYLSAGGFGKIHKAEWKGKKEWNESDHVVLKSLNNSQSITFEFLTEIVNMRLTENWSIIPCYGISQDPTTKDYIMIMRYMRGGNLRQCLQHKTSELSFEKKLENLDDIAFGMQIIHQKNLVHRDFHSGNVLSDFVKGRIADLGLCQPANHYKEENKIFGVPPYVAPEVLQGQPYTQKSDVYSFGIIAYELFANSYPYPEIDNLNVKVCLGYRPNMDKVPIPQLLKDLIKKCWDANSEKRPNAWELYETIYSWWEEIMHEKSTLFYQQYREIEEEYNYFSLSTPYKIYPTAVTISESINTRQISELVRKYQKTEQASSQLTGIAEQIKEIEKKLKELKKTLNNELTELVNWFIKVKNQSLKDERNEELENELWSLEDNLKEKGLSEEKIDKVIRYCENLFELGKQQLEQGQLQVNIEVLASK